MYDILYGRTVSLGLVSVRLVQVHSDWLIFSISTVFVTDSDQMLIVALRLIFRSFLYIDTLPSVLLRCWFGGRKGIRPVKN